MLCSNSSWGQARPGFAAQFPGTRQTQKNVQCSRPNWIKPWEHIWLYDMICIYNNIYIWVLQYVHASMFCWTPKKDGWTRELNKWHTWMVLSNRPRRGSLTSSDARRATFESSHKQCIFFHNQIIMSQIFQRGGCNVLAYAELSWDHLILRSCDGIGVPVSQIDGFPKSSSV